MYDNNYINGDMALLQLADKVEFSERISPACLPYDPEEKFSFSEGLITGWGYTEKTKIMKPRPMTSEVLREAEVFILPQDLCEKYSPFPITEKMICTFKGPLGVETTCQVRRTNFRKYRPICAVAICSENSQQNVSKWSTLSGKGSTPRLLHTPDNFPNILYSCLVAS